MSRASRVVAGVVVLGVAMVLQGCAGPGKRISSNETTTARLQDEVAAMQRSSVSLNRSVDSLSALVEEQTALVRNRRASDDVAMDDLQAEVGILRTDLDATKLALATLTDQVRFSGFAMPDSGVVGSGESQGAGDLRSIYDAAYQDLSRGNHGLAVMGFEEILQVYPTSELADNAQYWLGETYYVQGDYEKAIELFRKVPLNYPAGDKVPAALLKIGYCLEELKEIAAARSAFQDLIDRFPGSEEARLADAKLGRL